jgi:predicted aconitase
MYLTKEEELIYDGEFGWAQQKCMTILVRLGELFGGTRLIPIDSAHVSGVSYKTLGDAPIEFLKALAESDGKARVETTLNPQSLDPEYLGKLLKENIVEKQLTILKQFERMGFKQSLTCTPYYLREPKRNTHLAWAESSAVVYANSVLGAWTNREGGPSALAAAIIGKTPNYGIHQPKNRVPSVLVDVKTPPRNETEFGALGILLGEILKDEIPKIQGIRGATSDQLKQLGAALASTGMVNMFCRGHRGLRGETQATQRITVEAREMAKTIEKLSVTSISKPDLVFIGCPHCSLDEIKQIARLAEGKRVKADTEFWVCTSRYIRQIARNHVKKIEKTGGHVLDGVCTIVSYPEMLGVKTIMTNSAKTAYYAPTLNKTAVILAPLKECVRTAVGG